MSRNTFIAERTGVVVAKAAGGLELQIITDCNLSLRGSDAHSYCH
jgi:hypothetical protein